MPIAARSFVERPIRSSIATRVLDRPGEYRYRVRARRRAARCARARIEPARSVIASVACDAPMSAASTRRALGLIANSDGGRPPVETVSAIGMMRPMRMSSSTRAAIVDRASPVDFASSARVRGTPSRSSWKSSLTPDTPASARWSCSPRSHYLRVRRVPNCAGRQRRDAAARQLRGSNVRRRRLRHPSCRSSGGLRETLLEQHGDDDDDALGHSLDRRGQVVLHEDVR